MKIKEWLKLFLSGAAMGVASAIPGVSGGTIAVITGVFKKIVHAINNLFKSFKKSFLTLLPILIGMVAAIIPCFLIFDAAFEAFVFGLVTLFAGLIIGSLPGIFDEIKNVKPKVSYVVVSIISGLLAIGLGVGSVLLKDTFDISSQLVNPDVWFYFLVIPVGFLASSALVVPGISGSMLLLVLGFYTPIIESINDLLRFDFTNALAVVSVLACFAVGLVIGFFMITKLMGYLLDKHHDITYYSIIGFILGSTVALYFNKEIYDYYLVWLGQTIDGVKPLLQWYIEVPIGVVLGAVGALGSYQLVKHSRKAKSLEESNEIKE